MSRKDKNKLSTEKKKNDKQLSRAVILTLEEYGFEIEPLAFLELDLNRNSELGKAVLILDENELHYFEFENNDCISFSSASSVRPKIFQERLEKMTEEVLEEKIIPKKLLLHEKYNLEKLSETKIENQIIGAIFTAKYKEDIIVLARFSATCFKEANNFLQYLNLLLQVVDLYRKDDLSESEKAQKISEAKLKQTEYLEREAEKQAERLCPDCGREYPEEGRKFCPHCLPKNSIFKRLLSLFKPYKLRVIVLLFMIASSAIFGAVIPWLSGEVLYDNVIAKDPSWVSMVEKLGMSGTAVSLLLFLIIILFIVRLIQQVAGIIHGRQTANIVPSIVNTLRKSAFSSMQNLSLGFFLRKQTGSLMSRITNDSEEVTMFFIDVIPYLIVNIITVFFSIYMMFRMNWILALVSIFLLPPLIIISLLAFPRFFVALNKRASARRSVMGVFNDSLTGSRVVRSFGQEEQVNQHFVEKSETFKNSEIDVISEVVRFVIPFAITQALPMLLVWTLGAVFIIYYPQMLNFGQLLSFAAYLGMLQGPLQFFAISSTVFSNSMTAAQRMYEIIDARPDINERENALDLDVKGEIELKNVSFSYEVNMPILQDISFKIEAGKTLGIVGKSGAGKSTLVNLIARLYDVDSGEVLIDGHNVKDLSFKSLRGALAMVSQESYIFMGTVAENIAYARPDASLEEIVQAARAAACHDFIMDLPEAYDTRIGTGGRQLSGGQRQRISIARAILADPEILVLDEATAAVDTETERQIQLALEKLTKNRTTLIIAHRLSTLRNADKIIVIDEGKLLEQGTQSELENLGGVYRKLADLQRQALAIKNEGASVAKKQFAELVPTELETLELAAAANQSRKPRKHAVSNSAPTELKFVEFESNGKIGLVGK